MTLAFVSDQPPDNELEQQKYILTAALTEAFRGLSRDDLRAIRKIVLSLLNLKHERFTNVKYALTDGRILDAARDLTALVMDSYRGQELSEKDCIDLLIKAGRLYMPFISFKAMDAFEKAIKIDPAHGEAHHHLANLYERLKDEKKAERHHDLAKEHGYDAEFDGIAGSAVADDKTDIVYARDLALLPITSGNHISSGLNLNLVIDNTGSKK